MSAGRIITVRHGRPALSRDVVISAREYGEWWAQYDRSGLQPGETPSDRLLALARDAGLILASTLPRAIETAARLTGGAREATLDPLFVEAPLPPPPVSMIRLRPGQWGVISRAFWVLGYAPGAVENHRATWARVRSAAAYLSDCTESGDVLLCAHGYFNWMMDRHLRGRGWRRVEHNGGNHFWSWRVYEGAGARHATHAPSRADEALA